MKQKKLFVSSDHRQHYLTAVLFHVRTFLKQNTETVF